MMSGAVMEARSVLVEGTSM